MSTIIFLWYQYLSKQYIKGMIFSDSWPLDLETF